MFIAHRPTHHVVWKASTVAVCVRSQWIPATNAVLESAKQAEQSRIIAILVEYKTKRHDGKVNVIISTLISKIKNDK